MVSRRPQQIELRLELGLLDEFPEFHDCVRASVYGCGRAFKAIAADLDMSSSELSRKLSDNPGDNVNFPLRLLPALIRATGDLRPVYWLCESFLEDEAAKQKRALEGLTNLMPQLQAALLQLNAVKGQGG